MQKFGRWWKTQGVGIRAAIISGVFLLVTTMCPILIEMPRLIEETNMLMERYFAPDPDFDRIYPMPIGVDMLGDHDEQTIEVVFDRCWRSEDGRRIEQKDEIHFSITPLLTSPKHIRVEDILIVQDKFQPTPALSEISSLRLTPTNIGTGGVAEEIKPIILGKHKLAPYTEKKSLSEGRMFDIDYDKPLLFKSEIILPPNGMSTFHLEATLLDSKGNKYLIVSEPFTYGSIRVENPSLLKFSYPEAGVVFVDCDTE